MGAGLEDFSEAGHLIVSTFVGGFADLQTELTTTGSGVKSWSISSRIAADFLRLVL